MDFRPEVGEQVTIDQLFVFTAHPAAPGFPYGQQGRRGTVYQIKLTIDGSYHAIKVFSELFQDQRNAITAQRLKTFAGLPGLEACYRKVITSALYPALTQNYPQLNYAVLMPWVDGETWYDLIGGQQALTPEQSCRLAQSFLHCLVEMEKRQIAHCDLSGANLLMRLDTLDVSLVDVEEMYSPDMNRPDPKKLPAGTPGYQHKSAARGLWGPDADRFAGAVLLAEMLGWCNETVRQNAYDCQYFQEEEVQTRCQRYEILRSALRREWGSPIASAFTQAWESDRLEDCLPFQQWEKLLQDAAAQLAQAPANERAVAPVFSDAYIDPAHPAGVSQAVNDQPAPILSPAVSEQIQVTAAQAHEAVLPPEKRLEYVYSQVELPNINSAPPWPQSISAAWLRPANKPVRLALIALCIIAVLGGAVWGGIWLLTPRGSSSVQGSVQGQQSGMPIQANVTLNGSGLRLRQTADAQGQYTFNNLPEMDAEITLEADGYAPVSTTIHVPATGAADAGTLALSLTGVRFIGQVTDAQTNAGIQGAAISVDITYTDGQAGFSREQPAAQKGSFDFSFAIDSPAQANITVQSDGYQEKTFSLQVQPGEQYQIPDFLLISTK